MDDLKQFYGGAMFNNYACEHAPGTECKSLGECTTEGDIFLRYTVIASQSEEKSIFRFQYLATYVPQVWL